MHMANSAALETALKNPRRLQVLYDEKILDTPEERLFDRITDMICRELDVPISLVSIVETNRQFFKSQKGLSHESVKVRETPIQYSLCQYVVEQNSTIAIEDTRTIKELSGHPAVTESKIVAYLGVPLIVRGQVLGALCAADKKPRRWSEEQINLIEKRANFIRAEMDAWRRLANMSAA